MFCGSACKKKSKQSPESSASHFRDSTKKDNPKMDIDQTEANQDSKMVQGDTRDSALEKKKSQLMCIEPEISIKSRCSESCTWNATSVKKSPRVSRSPTRSTFSSKNPGRAFLGKRRYFSGIVA